MPNLPLRLPRGLRSKWRLLTRKNLPLEEFRPAAKLVTKTTLVDRPRFPVIDAHNHLGASFGGGWDQRPLGQLLDQLDAAGVTHYVDLDGGWGEEILEAHLKKFKEPAPERFQVFGGVDWSRWADLGDAFPEWAAGRLQVQKDAGAQGLKIWKMLGLGVRDERRRLVKVDDARLRPIWEMAGALGWPVLVHVADPVAFFDPIDETNERWEELAQHPDWHFGKPGLPAFAEILDGFRNVVKRHRGTTFVGAHVGCYAENLEWVGQMLDECPNYWIDLSARLSELGRQPYTARKFFIKYQDRILFGSDLGPNVEAYRLYWRFLETDDEYFNYRPGPVPQQGRWQAYGLYLPDEVLRKVYRANAAKVLGL